MEEQEIIEKLNKFFDKEELTLESKYFLTKKMNEEYWEEMQEEENGDDLLGELGEEEPEQEEPEESEEIAAEPKTPKKKKITIKKPKVIAKREEPEKDGLI